jgi:surfactin synthase thioesterase subunit
MKKPQLFLLHFAGGNRYSFQFLVPLLKDFEVTSLELPGRGRRMNEPLIRNFDLAAKDIHRQIAEKLTGNDFMIYGHSMGAYLALRVANMLEASEHQPAYLFVSGNAGPGIRSGKNRFLLNRDQFKEELASLGGVPEELLEDRELYDLFEPILRADFEIADRNDIDDEEVTASPLFAIMGSREEDAAQITNWSKYTRSRFDFEIMEGDHFFIHKHPERIAAIIKSRYDQLASFQHR